MVLILYENLKNRNRIKALKLLIKIKKNNFNNIFLQFLKLYISNLLMRNFIFNLISWKSKYKVHFI